MDILTKIFEAKKADLVVEQEQVPLRRAIELSSTAPPPHPILPALKRADRVNIIAEVKRASPSRGDIRPGSDPVEVARLYAAAEAAAISVLTESRFFLGA